MPQGTLILDKRQNPIQTFRKVAGSATELVLNDTVPQSFTPNDAVATLYEVRTTGDIRIAAHEAGYTFDKPNEPTMWAFEIDIVELGPAPSRAQTVTVVGDTGAATVTFTKLV